MCSIEVYVNPPYCTHSCVAVSDLLGTRQVLEVAAHIPDLWKLLLRVRDDIKVGISVGVAFVGVALRLFIQYVGGTCKMWVWSY